MNLTNCFFDETILQNYAGKPVFQLKRYFLIHLLKEKLIIQILFRHSEKIPAKILDERNLL